MIEWVNLGEKLLIHNTDGQRVFLDQNDINMTIHMLEHGEWEPHVRQIIDASLNEGSVYIDVGANIGLHSLYAAQKVGEGGKVLSFEPNKKLYKLLKANMETNGFLNRTELYNSAVSDHNGTEKFYIYDEHASMSGFMKEHSDFEADCFVQDTRVIKLDDVCDQKVDLIKIDVEGFEYDVLNGARKLIEKNKDNITILFEWQPGDIIERRGEDILDKTLDLFQGWECYVAQYLQPLRKVDIENKKEIKDIKCCDLIMTKRKHFQNILGCVRKENISSNKQEDSMQKDLEHAHKAFYEAVAVQNDLKKEIETLKKQIQFLQDENSDITLKKYLKNKFIK